jgi:sugar phosphate isomerase/epimerase
MSHPIYRRELFATAAGATLASFARTKPASAEEPASPKVAPQVRYCLNMSTIREHKLSLVEKIDLAAKAGYDAIEPWIGDLQQFADGGGNLDDLKKRIADQGLTVESAIGFARWIVEDDAERAKGLEAARRDMDLLKRIGGTRIAAPPAGATNEPRLDLLKMAERYRALLEVGQEIGVTPQLEVWGFSKNLSRLGETTFVAIESGHPAACILPDVYHIYKGGSEFEGLSLLSGKAIHVFHMNDYPDQPPRTEIADAHRVYPGDGVAPLSHILRLLFANGFQGVLSLELFNRDYWRQDPMLVARTGLEKMKTSVAKALEGAAS